MEAMDPKVVEHLVGTFNTTGPSNNVSGSVASTSTSAVVNPNNTELDRINEESLRSYAVFRDNMLRHFALTKMRRRNMGGVDGLGVEDPGLFMERRKKNNEAAKRSRDARRAKEDEVAIRAAFLEQENLQLKWEVAKIKAEIGKAKTLILAEAVCSQTGQESD